MSNFEEFVADTDPTDSNSLLRVTGLSPNGNSVIVEWQGGQECSSIPHVCVTDKSNPFGPPCIPISPPTAPQVTITNLPASSSGWYKVKAERP